MIGSNVFCFFWFGDRDPGGSHTHHEAEAEAEAEDEDEDDLELGSSHFQFSDLGFTGVCHQ